MKESDGKRKSKRSGRSQGQQCWRRRSTNNTRMISIINGQFDCQTFDKNVVSRNIPELAGKVTMLCSVSIPPYFGYFSGYLTLWLTRIPTPRELEDLRADARSLSSDIYDREFLR